MMQNFTILTDKRLSEYKRWKKEKKVSKQLNGKHINKQNKTFGRKLTRLTPTRASVPSFTANLLFILQKYLLIKHQKVKLYLGLVMKANFRIEHLGRSFKERFGHWEGTKKNISTPALWISCQGGAIPNLTPETIEYLNPNLQFAGILVPFQYHLQDVEVLKKFNKGIDLFMGLPPNQWNVLVSPQDPGVDHRQGYHSNKSISLWDVAGNRVAVDFSLYNEALKSLKPDAYVPLCDGETPKNSTYKRISKACTRTLQYLDKHIEQKDDCFIFGAVEGGFDIEARKNNAEQVSKRPVDGFCLDGFNITTSEASQLKSNNELKELIDSSVIPNLPEEKPKLYLGICNPRTILEFVAAGVDMFDSSYTRLMTDQGKALVFDNTLPDLNDKQSENVIESLITDKNDAEYEHENSEAIDLNNLKYKNDFRPISSKCDCYTCRKHTRAYINHLLLTKEMLAQILLTIHNLNHYENFFKTIRTAVHNDIFQELLARFE